jgi:hypothetical protein
MTKTKTYTWRVWTRHHRLPGLQSILVVATCAEVAMSFVGGHRARRE